jgi:hypothetical protein
VGKRKRPSKVERLLGGCNANKLSDDAVDRLADRWRHTFAQSVRGATGQFTHLGFDWHAFSYSFVHALQGDAARAEYRSRQRRQRFLVLDGPTMTAGFACESETLPSFDRAGVDVYVVPEDFSWTMVFTHEGDWLGPYFTTADWARTRVPAERAVQQGRCS